MRISVRYLGDQINRLRHTLVPLHARERDREIKRKRERDRERKKETEREEN